MHFRRENQNKRQNNGLRALIRRVKLLHNCCSFVVTVKSVFAPVCVSLYVYMRTSVQAAHILIDFGIIEEVKL